MVIIRESPQKPKTSGDQQWPPKSPHEALLSSPSGRKRYEQRYLDRRSISPSPRKRPRLDGQELRKPHETQPNGDGKASSGGEEEEEDEETLRLQLAAIQAKLKLKKLQAARTHSKSHDIPVQVPLSPVRSNVVKQAPSPTRVLLGIDKGIRASDISLKRVSAKKMSSTEQSHASRPLIGAQNQFGPSLVRTNKQASVRQLSFSERLAASRSNDKHAEEKRDRIMKARTQGFNTLQPQGLQGNSALGKPVKVRSALLQSEAVPQPDSVEHQGSISNAQCSRARDPEIPPLKSQAPLVPDLGGSLKCALSRDEKTPCAEPEAVSEPMSGFSLSRELIDQQTLGNTLRGKELYSIPRLLKEVKSPDYSPPDCESDYVVFGIVAHKSAPMEQKGGPRTASTDNKKLEDDRTATSHHGRPKYMSIRLTDLRWDINLFLFGTGFTRWWKLTPGTVVGLLNPEIMPPRGKRFESGAFSLKISSAEDTILEIGRSADLGFCTAKTADGTNCTAWVDKRKTTVCEFHIALQVEKAKRGRMEINTMGGGGVMQKGRPGSMNGKSAYYLSSKKKYINSRTVNAFEISQGFEPKKSMFHDRHIGETMYIVPKEMSLNGGSAAAILDEDMEIDEDRFSRGMSKEELRRKRLLERKKEKDLAKKLASQGKGAGSAYLNAQVGSSPSAILRDSQNLRMSRSGGEVSDKNEVQETTDASMFRCLMPTAAPTEEELEASSAQSLGLLRKSASAISLGSKKGRRRDDAEGLGWSGAFKRGLLYPAEIGDTSIETTTIRPELHEMENNPAKVLDATSSTPQHPGKCRTVHNVAEDSDDLEIIG